MKPKDRQRQEILDLYAQVWPHVPPGIRQAAIWGSDWFEVSTPFLVYADGRLVAHVGVIACDLTSAQTKIAALHAVCVHPEARGRGHCREAMNAALAYVEQKGFETAILWSEKIDLYRRFDFKPMQESVFEGTDFAIGSVLGVRLDLKNETDVELLREALRIRRPVSDGLAAADDGWHFWIDLALWTQMETPMLIHLPQHDAIMICDVEDGVLSVYDVIARELPPISVLCGGVLEATGGAVSPRRVRVYFTPDRLPEGEKLKAVEHPFEDVLMVRGKPLLLDSGEPFALSPLTRT